MGRVGELRQARAAPEWETDPIESGFDAPCHHCGHLWPVETMLAGEEGRTCPVCEEAEEVAIRTARFTHGAVWAGLLVDAPAVGIGLWLASGLVTAHAVFPALVWTALCVGQATIAWGHWQETRSRAALVSGGMGFGAALACVAGALALVL